jgi:pyruvate ferredoxin oxidoreductase beta subunit
MFKLGIVASILIPIFDDKQNMINFLYVCYDNGAYMNTGIQRSAATPKYAKTTTSPIGEKIHGKETWKKPITQIVAAHGIKYCATANIAFFTDLQKKVKKALSINGPTFIHAYTPCPVGWWAKSSDTVQIARLATQTNVFPLYTIENGELKLDFKNSKPKPIEEYLRLQGRYKKITKKRIKYLQKRTDEYYKFLESLEKKGKIFPTTVDW